MSNQIGHGSVRRLRSGPFLRAPVVGSNSRDDGLADRTLRLRRADSPIPRSVPSDQSIAGAGSSVRPAEHRGSPEVPRGPEDKALQMGFLKARAIAAYILGVAANEIIFLITAPRRRTQPHPDDGRDRQGITEPGEPARRRADLRWHRARRGLGADGRHPIRPRLGPAPHGLLHGLRDAARATSRRSIATATPSGRRPTLWASRAPAKPAMSAPSPPSPTPSPRSAFVTSECPATPERLWRAVREAGDQRLGRG
jgi:hypothetical protein